MAMTREQHLAWCKQRAMGYVNSGDFAGAAASMISDLGKHPETKSSVEVAGMLMMTVKDERSARAYVEGFN